MSADNLTEVSNEEFFAALYADNRDIMPTLEHADRTMWLARDRSVFGVSYPGWKDTGDPNHPKRWFIARVVR